MNIRQYTIADFRDFLEGRQEWPWSTGVLPISRHRAACHVANPRAADDDVVLLVGYDGDEVVSYMGILPDRVALDSGSHKFGWLTTWWAKPAAEGAGSVFLLMQAIRVYERRIGVSEYSESAARIYRAMKGKFRTIVPREVTLIHWRPDFAEIAAKRIGTGPMAMGLCHALTRCTDVAMGLRAWLWQRRVRSRLQSLRVEYISTIDFRSQQFLDGLDRSAELFRRDAPEFEWMVRHRWPMVAPLPDGDSSRYWFSATAERFEYIMMHLRRPDGSIGALLVLSIRDELLKVPYAFVAPDMYDDAGLAVCQNAQALRARVLLVVDAKLTAAIRQQRYPAFREKTMARNSLWTLNEPVPERIYLHDGDGDCAFT